MRIYIVIILLSLVNNSYALDQYKFQNFGINEGLPHSDAKCFLQSESGFMWIGTNSGLVKFDGYSLETFYNNKNVDYNRINSIVNLKSNTLLLATEGGFCLFDLQTQLFRELKYKNWNSALINAEKSALLSYKNQCFWFKINYTFYYADYKGDTIYQPHLANTLLADSDVTPFIFQTYIDPNDNIWLLHEFGLECIALNQHNETRQVYAFDSRIHGEERNPCTDCIIDKKNDLWITSYNKIFRIGLKDEGKNFKSSYVKIYDYPSSFFNNRISAQSALEPTSIILDKENTLWIGTREGLLKINANRNIKDTKIVHIIESPSNKYGLSSNLISSLYLSQNNILFIGTWGAGFNLLDPHINNFYNYSFSKINNKLNNSESFVRCILEDSNKNIWIGLGFNGVYIFDFEMKHHHTIQTTGSPQYAISDPRIRALSEDLNGDIWIATMNGLNKINKNTYKTTQLFTNPDNEQSMASNANQCLAVDEYNRIWSGSWENGITIIDQSSNNLKYERLNKYSRPHYLMSNKVNAILYDKNNKQLLVTSKKGLDKILLDAAGNIRKIYHYSDTNLFQSNYLWPIAQENDSVFWIGSLGGGLTRASINGNTLHTQNYMKKDGAPTNDIEGLLIDDAGHIWLSGLGISRFTPKTNEFWNFDIYDGLQSNSFKVGSQHKGKSGRMYFGSTKGLNYFYPSKIEKKTIHHKTIISDIIIHNNEKINTHILARINTPNTDPTTLKLAYVKRNIEISFTTLNFFNAKKANYRYRLVGYNPQWILLKDGTHSAYFSNLSPGKYRFEVLSSNNEDSWSNTPLTFQIQIIPPWWLSKVALILYFIIIIIAFYLTNNSLTRFRRLREDLNQKIEEERTMEELHQTKLRFFTNISHEFRTPLSLIISPIEKLISQDLPFEERQWYYQIIGKNARRLMRLVNEIVDFRKSETGKTRLKVQLGNLSELVIPVFDGFEELAVKHNIHTKINSNTTHSIWYDAVQLEKIVYNILSNAIKNTPKNGNIHLTISDDPIPKPEFNISHEVKPDYLSKHKNFSFFKVVDNGTGISQKDLPSIFERFYQTNTSADNSSGIGLALVKSLVLLHHGYIRVSSEPNKGSEFLIAFPINKQPFAEMDIISSDNKADFQIPTDITIPDEVLPETKINYGDLRRKSILIVEDHTEVQQFLVKELSIKYEVFFASNGQQGLRMARDKMPNVIITDVMMPIMDGYEMTRLLKNDIATSHIPIIMLTAKTKQEHEIEGTQSGADSYIRKPFSIRLLDLYIKNSLANIERIKQLYGEDALLDATSLAQNDRDKQFLAKVETLICDNIDNADFILTDLIRELGMSRTRFYQKIKSVSGMTAKEFFNTVKIRKAVQFLVVKDMSVSEVSYMVGFTNISHFSRSFKNHYGISPSLYKKQHQQKQKPQANSGV